MTDRLFSVGSVGLERVQMEAPSEHTAKIRTLEQTSSPFPAGGIRGLVSSQANSSGPVPFDSPRSAQYKIVCSFQNFFEQQKSSSSSVVHFLVGQELEFKLVDTTRGDEEVMPFDAWKWTLVRGGGSDKAAKTFSGSGSFLRTNKLELGEWTLIASCKNRNESCAIRLIGESFENWKIFAPLMPKARTDPDAYATRLSSCLEIDKDGKSCGGAADPTDGNELATIGGDAKLQLERLKSRLAKTQGLTRYPIQAMYTHLGTMRNYALRAFLAVVDGKWMITDWTLPETQGKTGWFWGGKYEGGWMSSDQAGIREAFKAWEDGNRYAPGSVHWRVLTPADQFELRGSFRTSGTTDLDEWSEGAQWVGTAFLAASIVPIMAWKKIGGRGASLSFGVSAGINLTQRLSQGFNTRHDLLENGMDFAMIALAMLGASQMTAENFAKSGSGRVKVFAEGVEKLFVNGKEMTKLAKFELIAGGSLLLVCGGQAGTAAWEIVWRDDLSLTEKYHLLYETLGLFALQGALMVVSWRTNKYVKVPDAATPALQTADGAGKPSTPATGGGKPLEGEKRTLKFEGFKTDGTKGETSGAEGNTGLGKGEKPAKGDERLNDGEAPPEGEGKAPTEGEGEKSPEGKGKDSEQERNPDEFPGETNAERHETTASRGKKKLEEKDPSKEKERETENRAAPPEPEPPRWPREDASPPPPYANGKPAERSWNQWFQNERMPNVPNVKLGELKVVAYAEINGKRFVDYNQNARLKPLADEHTAIYEIIKSRASKLGKEISGFPNWKHLNLHAEGGLLYQLYRAGLTRGAKIVITVEGRKVCGFCLKDLIELAKALEIKELTVIEKNSFNELTPERLFWKEGENTWTDLN